MSLFVVATSGPRKIIWAPMCVTRKVFLCPRAPLSFSVLVWCTLQEDGCKCVDRLVGRWLLAGGSGRMGRCVQYNSPISVAAATSARPASHWSAATAAAAAASTLHPQTMKSNFHTVPGRRKSRWLRRRPDRSVGRRASNQSCG